MDASGIRNIAHTLKSMCAQYGHPDWSAHEFIDALSDVADKLYAIADDLPSEKVLPLAYCILNRDGKMFWSESCIFAESNDGADELEAVQLDDPDAGWHLAPFYAAPQAVLTGPEAPHMPLDGQAAPSHRPTAEPAVAAPHSQQFDKRERLWDIAGMLEFQATQALAMGELNVKIDAMTIVPKIVEVMRAASGPEVHSAKGDKTALDCLRSDIRSMIDHRQFANYVGVEVIEELLKRHSYVGEKPSG